MLPLRKNEYAVFVKLPSVPTSVATIVRETSLPRMTVHTNLLRLQKYGLVKSKKVNGKQKRYWSKAPESTMRKKLQALESTFLSHRDIQKVPLGEFAKLVAYSGKKNILTALHTMLYTHKRQRICVMQTARNWNTWVNLLGKREVNKLNKAVTDNEMIYLGVRTQNIPRWFHEDSEAKEAYGGRAQGTKFIDESYFEPDTSLYILPDQVLIVNLKAVTALEINDRRIALVFFRMFTYIHEHSETNA